ncbi:MAG: fibrobacter succinogenes major paralogous domain-containing protein, partial [Candidatus Colwellbacteria bacterium]|nr:fibrobacter succinogenes major paralogous domain-containing protein [Candidatus Colwellbacteria bacterium]
NEDVCTPDDSCNSNLICDSDSCICVSDSGDENNYAELGDPCFDGGSCSAESPLCNPNHGLICDSSSCKCVGNPVITGFSPLGGFCNNNRNTPCSKDSDCNGGTCNFTTPNTSSGNFFTILGYNFGTYNADKSKVKFISIASHFNCGDDLNYNNYNYETVEIGNQCWIAENLKTNKYNDGSSIDYPGNDNPEWTNNSSGAYAFYNNDINDPITSYGYFYNWYAVNSGKLCPLGWEIPSDNQWYLLESFIEPSINFNTKGWRGSVVAEKLKSTSGWGSYNGTDDYGFTALRGGFRSVNGSFLGVSSGFWWSRTEDTSSMAYVRGLADYNNNIYGGTSDKRVGASVRCVYVGGDPSVSLVAKNPKEVNTYCDNSWTNTSITVALPESTSFIALGAEADDLDVEVTTGEEKSYKISDNPNLELVKWNTISRPGICAMSSSSANTGESIVYYGINLNDGKAYFGNSVKDVLGYSVNSFTNNITGLASVPNLSDGKTSTFIKKISPLNNVPVYSNFLDFTKLAEGPQGPFISSSTPMQGPSGQYITIFGGGFNGFKGDSKVLFRKSNDASYVKEAKYQFPLVCAQSVWSDNQIIVKVPENIDDADYELILKIGEWPEVVADGFFKVDSSLNLSPGLCKISPKSGPNKSPVFLWGEYFGTSSDVIFSLNKLASGGKIDSELEADKISINVPDLATTGPVKVLRDGLSSNALNFSVASCSSSNDCDSGICCLPGTVNPGSCVTNSNDCFSGTPPSSVFQWVFTTGFNTNPIPTSTNLFSCASYNFCPTDKWTCPNTPGLCSPYNATGKLIETGTCEHDCNNFNFCKSPNSCFYNSDIDKCVLDNKVCFLEKEIEYNLGYGTITKTAVCKNYTTSDGDKQYYEIEVGTICPTDDDGVVWNLVPGTNNKCINTLFGNNSTCSLCPDDSSCQAIQSSNQGEGVCVSPEVCSGNSICYENNKCQQVDVSSCQCCCEISANTSNGNPACCAPLVCAGTCGQSAVLGSTNTDFGLCSGCALAGTNTDDWDLACNCISNSGQYCAVNSQNPNGACLDCTSLNRTSCLNHSAVCCWDSGANNNNGLCRGGASDDSIWGIGSPNRGYCPYYNCDPDNITTCDTSEPVVTGNYINKDSCIEGCKKNCSQIEEEDVCKEDASCCWNGSTDECFVGIKYSNNQNDANYGLCSYFNCVTAGNTCIKGTSTTKYLDQAVCDNNCAEITSGFGGPCYTYPNINNFCSFDLCNKLNCLQDDGAVGDDGNIPESCGVCCCDPDPNNDKCGDINDNLTCVADKGLCTGNDRGLCCGCSSDSDCSPIGIEPEQVGCGFDTCCKARPKINKDINKLAELDVIPEHQSDEVCRNALIEINFDQRMDPLSLDNNILLLEENDSGPCSVGTYQISWAENTNKNIFARMKNIFNQSVNFLAKLIGKTAIASPDSNKVYCAVLGSVSFVNNTGNNNQTTAYFKPNNLLKPETRYFVVVKGDEDLDSFNGVKSSFGIGMNGTGYYNNDGTGWEESGDSSSIKFNGVSYPNSYIWDFITMDVNSSGSGICEIDYVKISPESYLFQTTENDLNENDTDQNHSTFNSAKDKDVQYLVKAYSKDNQILTPTDEYNWVWDWQIGNNQILEFNNNVSAWSVDGDKKLVQVKSGVTDGKSNISVTVDIVPGSIVTAGDGISNTALAYVLICNNPWPAINEMTGLWYP